MAEVGNAQAVELLVPMLADCDCGVRDAAKSALDRTDPAWRNSERACAATRDLVRKLTDASLDVRAAAAWALGEISEAQAVDPLKVALADPSWKVQAMAARALGKVATAWPSSDFASGSFAALIGKLGDDEDVGAAALKALEGIDPRWQNSAAAHAAVPALIEKLTDPDIDVRVESARVLSMIGGDRAIGPLIATLTDDTQWVRREAIVELGKIGNSTAVAYLAAILTAPEPSNESAAAAAVHEQCDAAEALGQIGDATLSSRSSLRSRGVCIAAISC